MANRNKVNLIKRDKLTIKFIKYVRVNWIYAIATFTT
jgi:hypothetical protein